MTVTIHDPVPVHIVEDATGSHLDPPLDETWDELMKLRWQAGVVAHETGLRIGVVTGTYSEKRLGRWRIVPGQYSILVGSGSLGPLSFRSAWVYLNGVSAGHRAAMRDGKCPICGKCHETIRREPRRWPEPSRGVADPSERIDMTDSTNTAEINNGLLRVAVMAADLWVLNEGPHARTKADYTRGIVETAVMTLIEEDLVVPADDVNERLQQGVTLWRRSDDG